MILMSHAPFGRHNHATLFAMKHKHVVRHRELVGNSCDMKKG